MWVHKNVCLYRNIFVRIKLMEKVYINQVEEHNNPHPSSSYNVIVGPFIPFPAAKREEDGAAWELAIVLLLGPRHVLLNLIVVPIAPAIIN